VRARAAGARRGGHPRRAHRPPARRQLLVGPARPGPARPGCRTRLGSSASIDPVGSPGPIRTVQTSLVSCELAAALGAAYCARVHAVGVAGRWQLRCQCGGTHRRHRTIPSALLGQYRRTDAGVHSLESS
jgi:hypothetical protein